MSEYQTSYAPGAHDIADRRGLQQLARKDVERYGVILLVGGLLNAESSMVFEFTGWPIAALAGLVVLAAYVIFVLVWGRKRSETFRYAGKASRRLWIPTLITWLVAHAAFFIGTMLWVYWISAVLFLVWGFWAFSTARKTAQHLFTEDPWDRG